MYFSVDYPKLLAIFYLDWSVIRLTGEPEVSILLKSRLLIASVAVISLALEWSKILATAFDEAMADYFLSSYSFSLTSNSLAILMLRAV